MALLRSLLRIAVALVVVLFRATAYPWLSHYLTYGWVIPIHHIESLHHPVPVAGWTSSGLTLTSGRSISIPNITHLPSSSPALREFTKRGIEITPNGQIFCLVRVHHWCGNDDVVEDIRRINLADALIYLGVGETITPPSPQPGSFVRDHTDVFDEFGWNISDFIWSGLQDTQ